MRSEQGSSASFWRGMARTPDDRIKHTEKARCLDCGALLHFPFDPLYLGRSMEACTNPSCPNHELHVVRFDVAQLETPPPTEAELSSR